MRRVRALARRLTDVVDDFSHAAQAQATAMWVRLRGKVGFPLGEADCAPIPVVLLPGILERSVYLAPLGHFLAKQGHPVHVIDTLGWNISGLDESVERSLRALHRENVHGAVLVAHSKGGLIGKALLMDERLGDAAIGLVALSAPFSGSTFGGILQKLPFVGRTPLGLFVSGNQDLQRLIDDEEVNGSIVSLAPEWDQMIPGGSHLEGAVNVTLKGRGHFRPVDDPAVWEQVHGHIHGVSDALGTDTVDG